MTRARSSTRTLPDPAAPAADEPGRPGRESAPPVRPRLRHTLLGPAFVAAIAYVDPGNFATNVQAGARFGPLLLWVVLGSSAVAMLLQYLSAKLGLATGQSLPELCRRSYSPAVVRGLWLQAEAVVVMTDLAEVVGGAVALNVLYRLPLPVGGLVVGAVSLLMLPLRQNGRRRFEVLMAAALALLLGAFAGTALASGDPTRALPGLVPRLTGSDSLVLAGGIVGATVMPHVIYLHSALTGGHGGGPSPGRGERAPTTDWAADTRRPLLRRVRTDVLTALSVAGATNAGLLVSAAVLFHPGAPDAAASLSAAHGAYVRLAGPAVATTFALALLISGLAGTSVGMYAGQVVMGGFLRRRVPVLVRRLLTLVPAMAVLGSRTSPTDALVVSQVALSFGIPFALVPLVLFTQNRRVMGGWVNRRPTTYCAWAVSAVVICLNLSLLVALAG